MTLIEKENTYFFTSADSQLNKSGYKDLNGSRFSVKLNNEISVPRSAVDVTIECVSANIWFTQPNISAELQNDKLWFYYEGVLISITLDKGLYSVSEINESVRRKISQLDMPGEPGQKFPEDSIAFRGNNSTQKVELRLIKGLWFLPGPEYENNMAGFLGFTEENNTAEFESSATFDGQLYISAGYPMINQINSFLLHGDIVKGGLQINNYTANIIAEIQLSAQAGTQINYLPYHPFKIDANHLKQGSVDKVTFWLTDEQNRQLDMSGENFSFTLVIKYKILLDQIMSVGNRSSLPTVM